MLSSLSIKSRYPRAFDRRLPRNHPIRKHANKGFLKAATLNFLLLQLLFLGLFAYAFGSLFQQTSHTHNLKFVFVDYDGGAIGQAVREAYASLQGDSFPSLVERPPSELETEADLLETVCRADYWAALYISKGASDTLHNALSNPETTPPTPYNRSNTITYIWNEALYPSVSDSISSSLTLLSSTARILYTTANGTGNITSITSPTSLSILANPWTLQSTNIQPTTQGSRVIYNTVVIILVMIQEFFYLGTINGLYAQCKLYARSGPYRIILLRNVNSLSYTFIGSLCVAGAIFAFKSGWDINGVQFVLTWMAFWLFAHTNFLTLDVFTIWVPAPFVPMALILWIVTNVTSILLPFQLNPGFYRVGYALPAHEVYQTLIDIWSGGCNPRLRYSLPVLFAWEVVGLGLSSLGVFKRCHFAVVGEERAERELMEKVDAAVEFRVGGLMGRGHDGHRGDGVSLAGEDRGEEVGGSGGVGVGGEVKREVSGTGKRPASEIESAPGLTEDGETGDEEGGEMREELEEIMERMSTRQRREREQERMDGDWNFGPAFQLPFSQESDSEDTV